MDMLDHWLSQHDGVITRAQAAICGLSGDAVDRLVRRGTWQTIHRGVYFVADRPFTADARIRCAVWSAGTNAVLSGEAAAFWHRVISEAPSIIEVTTPRKGRSRAEGCRLRRRDIHSKDIVERRGMRVTSLDLTVLEASIGKAHIMDRALQRHTNLEGLRQADARNPGRAGASEAKRLLKVAAHGARSEGERLLIGEFRSRDIRGWVANFRWGGYELDIAFAAEMVAIEIDGWAYHSDHDAFQRDRIRQNDITPNWTILRYTWFDLTERMEHVIAEITSTVDRIRCSQPR
ncbi:type IV toxin-antitoxin system AbiEi family antitoxin domain-containing protein [Rhodococcus sp. ARC_M5]|uniref:type IV toxin-antitoxin system AbiEi family antitoxin domain-containing protein n=1 Tax=Rhodococcus sp. ARC_M5 TaxID=2928851 RepID=UPI0027E09D5D|nr:type IV toxin-antitoxin system AbiEi family antitoxin domain-containing protein [Rhodococcus sp. ARC_M5]